jgi:hypothetical protein
LWVAVRREGDDEDIDLFFRRGIEEVEKLRRHGADSIAWVVSNYLPAPFQRDRPQARRRDLFEIPDAALIVPAVALTSTSSARSVIRSRAFFTFRRRYCNSADRWNGLKETQFSLIKASLIPKMSAAIESGWPLCW